jgi:hypothetical protein
VVLISNRHVIGNHCGPGTGSQVVFTKPGGGYEVRTVVSASNASSLTAYSYYIGLLDSDITTITPMPIMPANWATYLRSITNAEYMLGQAIAMPVLNKGYTAGDWIRILGCYGLNPSNGVGPAHACFVNENARAPMNSWSSPVIGGDSNGPTFVPINGAPVLLMCMNWVTGAFYLPSFLGDIQDAMNTLLPGYSITYPNLAGFPTY